MTARVAQRRNGIAFQVRLTPKGGRDTIEGWCAAGGQSFLKARVRAAPEDGNANAALIALLAKTLGVPKSRLAVASGHKARLKIIEAAGDTAVLIARLNGLGEAT